MKGRKIKAGLTVHKEYEVSFQVFPSVFKGGWHNVVHFTIGGNSGKSGDRIPSIWFHTTDGDTKSCALLICADVSGNVDYRFTTHRVSVQKWTAIKVKQVRNEDGVYVYEIMIDGKVVFSKVNTLPKTFRHVNVYASDPWYAPQVGYIKDLYYGGKCKILFSPGGGHLDLESYAICGP